MTARRSLRHACALLLTVAASGVRAGSPEVDGRELLARCTDAARQGACLNELIAIADMHDVVAAWGLSAARWCMPASVPPERLREVVVDHLDDPGRRLDEPSMRLVADAYARAFPCP